MSTDDIDLLDELADPDDWPPAAHAEVARLRKAAEQARAENARLRRKLGEAEEQRDKAVDAKTNYGQALAAAEEWHTRLAGAVRDTANAILTTVDTMRQEANEAREVIAVCGAAAARAERSTTGRCASTGRSAAAILPAYSSNAFARSSQPGQLSSPWWAPSEPPARCTSCERVEHSGAMHRFVFADVEQPPRPLLAEDRYVVEELRRLKDDLATAQRERDEARAQLAAYGHTPDVVPALHEALVDAGHDAPADPAALADWVVDRIALFEKEIADLAHGNVMRIGEWENERRQIARLLGADENGTWLDLKKWANHVTSVIVGDLLRERNEARNQADRSMQMLWKLWDATGIDRNHDGGVDFVAGGIRQMVDSARVLRTQIRPQLARAEADVDRLRALLDDGLRIADDMHDERQALPDPGLGSGPALRHYGARLRALLDTTQPAANTSQAGSEEGS